jgi:hypothetical protein
MPQKHTVPGKAAGGGALLADRRSKGGDPARVLEGPCPPRTREFSTNKLR